MLLGNAELGLSSMFKLGLYIIHARITDKPFRKSPSRITRINASPDTLDAADAHDSSEISLLARRDRSRFAGNANEKISADRVP